MRLDVWTDAVHSGRTVVLQIVEADRPILISFNAEFIVGVFEPAPLRIVGANARAVYLDITFLNLFLDEIRLSCLASYH